MVTLFIVPLKKSNCYCNKGNALPGVTSQQEEWRFRSLDRNRIGNRRILKLSKDQPDFDICPQKLRFESRRLQGFSLVTCFIVVSSRMISGV